MNEKDDFIYRPPSEVKLRQLRARFQEVQLLIIDEISMISWTHLVIMDQDLKAVLPSVAPRLPLHPQRGRQSKSHVTKRCYS